MCFEKVAETPADDGLLHQEGWILGLAAHPGIVTVMATPLPSDSPAILQTRAVPGRPLAAMDELSESEIAGLGAAVATTVADLHDVGITHRRLSADHIVVDTTGRPVLCGFSQAAAATGSPAPAVTADVMALVHTLAGLLVSEERPAGRTVLAGLLRRVGDGAGSRHGSARWLAERLGDERFAPRLPWRATAPLRG